MSIPDKWWVPKVRAEEVSDRLLAALSVRWRTVGYTPDDYVQALAVRIGRQMVSEPFPIGDEVAELLEHTFAMPLHEFSELTSWMDEERAGNELVGRIGDGLILSTVNPALESGRSSRIHPWFPDLRSMLVALAELVD